MAKILISWMAVRHDFSEGGTINKGGPTCTVHSKMYEGYDKHVLLTTAANPMDDTKYQRLVTHIRRHFRHDVEEIGMNISNSALIDLSAISKAVNSLLLTKYKNDEVHIFISPGTPTMQVAWYLASINLGMQIRMFQTLRDGLDKSGQEKIWVTSDQLGYMSALLRKESASTEFADTSDISIPETLKPIYTRASKIALADVSVLITGATGTGKELLAKHIHDSSHRKDKAFVAVNCAALGPDLLESRLFGYMKGAFTGAASDSKGLFHEANGGTIFLDEIGDVSPYMQQSLLRVLSKRELMRVGSAKVEPVNVRVLAATNKDLYDMSVRGQFRDDLYYRLSTCEIHLPSLAEYNSKSKTEVFTFLWSKASIDMHKNEDIKLPSAIKKMLLEYSYPGNIREMENIIYGLWAEVIGEVKLTDLPKRILNPRKEFSRRLKDVGDLHIRSVLESVNGNVTKASEILDISPTTLKSRLI